MYQQSYYIKAQPAGWYLPAGKDLMFSARGIVGPSSTPRPKGGPENAKDLVDAYQALSAEGYLRFGTGVVHISDLVDESLVYAATGKLRRFSSKKV